MSREKLEDIILSAICTGIVAITIATVIIA